MNDPVRALLAEVGSADRPDRLRGLRDQLHGCLEALLPETAVGTFNALLNETHDALIRRAVVLSETQMARLGHGPPPVPYAYLLFGSGGRREQTLTSDQDSGMLYDDPGPDRDEAEVQSYFLTFSARIVETLQAIGYPPCEGSVISSNADWCASLRGWQAKLDTWFAEASWEQVRYLLIMADCRAVYGDSQLADRLHAHFYRDTLEHPVIMRRMLDNTMRHKVLIGVFGQLLHERYGEESGSLDVKYGAYIPMVNAIRLLAVGNGIRETSTLERIERLAAQGRLGEADRQACTDAFLLFLRLRMMAAVKQEDGLYTNSGKVAGTRLTRELKRELRLALRVVQQLQRRVNRLAAGKLG